jgi:hypothetical protein
MAAEIPNECCAHPEERKSFQPTLCFWVHPCVISKLLTDLFMKSQSVIAKVFVVTVKSLIKASSLNSLQEGFFL